MNLQRPEHMDGEVLYTARTTKSKHVAGKAGHRPEAMLFLLQDRK